MRADTVDLRKRIITEVPFEEDEDVTFDDVSVTFVPIGALEVANVIGNDAQRNRAPWDDDPTREAQAIPILLTKPRVVRLAHPRLVPRKRAA